jgi:hypothetical protein
MSCLAAKRESAVFHRLVRKMFLSGPLGYGNGVAYVLPVKQAEDEC